MASVRKKGKYSADDLVDDFILHKVAQYVYYSSVKEFAKKLKVSQTDYERIICRASGVARRNVSLLYANSQTPQLRRWAASAETKTLSS